jgi:ABC-type phosphate/phosphonate transport system substrate-binding protein
MQRNSDDRMTRRQLAACLAGVAVGFGQAGPGRAQTGDRPFRLAISAAQLAGVNINDARASIHVWLQQAVRNLRIRVELVPEVFLDSERMIRAIREGALDGFTITTWEFLKASGLVDPGFLLLSDYIVQGLRYLVVVHRTSPVRSLAQLRDRHLLMFEHPDMCLSNAWLATLLASQGLPAPERLFSSQEARPRLTQVLLPVFFQRADAACVTNRGLATAIELNPQLGRDLRTLVASPALVTGCFAFHRACPPAERQRFQQALLDMGSDPASQQIMALFQATTFSTRTAAFLEPTLEMLRQYERLGNQGLTPAGRGVR